MVSHQRNKLKVGGLVPFTATDYPGKLAAVVFVQGCPWRCGYCHNPHLQERTNNSPVPWAEIMGFLQKRQGLIDAVVFSGGEPSMDPALASAINEVRTLGYSIGMHTGGTHPRRIKQVINHIDWIGLDIKADFDNYQKVTKIKNSGQPAHETLEIILASDVEFECRTTAHPSLISEKELLYLAQKLAYKGVKNYAIQIFRSQGCDDDYLNSIDIHNWPDNEVIHEITQLFTSFTLRRD